MNKEIKDKWCTALRSGEYTQGKHQLRNVTSSGAFYCCLGVLCDLFIKETGVGAWTDDGHVFEINDTSETYYLTNEVCIWADLPLPKDNHVDVFVGDDKLGVLNDCRNHNFNKIADKIEEYL